MSTSCTRYSLPSVALGLALAAGANAQCSLTITDRGEFPGVNGTIQSSALWDSDGPGPQPEVLVLGGSFTKAGESNVNSLVGWDGHSWTYIAPGASNVQQVIRHGNQLLVRGTVAGISAPMALWNGTAWTPVGTTSDTIRDVVSTSAGEIIAVGSFLTDVGTFKVARWDGVQWLGVGNPGTPIGFPFHITEFAGSPVIIQQLALNEPGGFCSASRYRTNIFSRLDGGSWIQFGQPVLCITGTLLSSTIHNNELWIAGRRFDSSFNPLTNLSDPWVGSWIELFSVRSMMSFGGNVHMVGPFTGTGNQMQTNAAGTGWIFGIQTQGTPYTLATFQGDLYMAGAFTGSEQYDSSRFATAPQNVGRYSSATGSLLPLRGTDGSATFFTTVDGQMLAGGNFSSIQSTSARIAAYDGSQWTPVASRRGTPLTGAAKLNGEIYAAARLPFGSNQMMLKAVGDQLLPIPGSPTSEGLNDVLAYNGNVYFAGRLVASYNGSTFTNNWPVFGQVFTMCEYNGDLIAAGDFTSINNIPAQIIARCSGGVWSPLGTGLFGTVYDVLSYRGDLIAAGNFRLVSGGPFVNLARWNGASWEAFAGGATGTVRSLCVRRGELIAGGEFTDIGGGLPIARLAAFDGSAWRSLASGINAPVLAVGALNEDIFVSGDFTTFDGAPAFKYARLSTQPGCCGSSDFNNDGDFGTDSDIEAFFACLAGNCCPTCFSSDFNNDGDFGTDSDIEAFFRVLSGGPC